MKKEHIYFYLVLATFIVSFVSLGFSLPRVEWSNGIDYLGVIVGILAVLVTVLIGLQLYNYIFARENLKQIIDGEVIKMIKDYEHVTAAHDKVHDGYDYIVTRFVNEKITDAIMTSIKELEHCENPAMKSNCLDYVMKESHSFLEHYRREDGPRIYVGKRTEYLYLLKKVDHMYVPELVEYIEAATEVEPHTMKSVGWE